MAYSKPKPEPHGTHRRHVFSGVTHNRKSLKTVSPLLCTQSRLSCFFSFTLKPSFSSSSSPSVRSFSSLLTHHRFLITAFSVCNVFNNVIFFSLRRFICCSLFYIFIVSFLSCVCGYSSAVLCVPIRLYSCCCLFNRILFYLFLFRNEKLEKKKGLAGLIILDIFCCDGSECACASFFF